MNQHPIGYQIITEHGLWSLMRLTTGTYHQWAVALPPWCGGVGLLALAFVLGRCAPSTSGQQWCSQSLAMLKRSLAWLFLKCSHALEATERNISEAQERISADQADQVGSQLSHKQERVINHVFHECRDCHKKRKKSRLHEYGNVRDHAGGLSITGGSIRYNPSYNPELSSDVLFNQRKKPLWWNFLDDNLPSFSETIRQAACMETNYHSHEICKSSADDEIAILNDILGHTNLTHETKQLTKASGSPPDSGENTGGDRVQECKSYEIHYEEARSTLYKQAESSNLCSTEYLSCTTEITSSREIGYPSVPGIKFENASIDSNDVNMKVPTLSSQVTNRYQYQVELLAASDIPDNDVNAAVRSILSLLHSRASKSSEISQAKKYLLTVEDKHVYLYQVFLQTSRCIADFPVSYMICAKSYNPCGSDASLLVNLVVITYFSSANMARRLLILKVFGVPATEISANLLHLRAQAKVE